MTTRHFEETILDYLDRYPSDRDKLERVLVLLRDGIDLADRNDPRQHATAGAVLFNRQGRILLVHHKGLDMWVQPGGHVEHHDRRLVDAALRELTEETGITRDQVRPLLDGPVQIDTGDFPAAPGRPAHLHVDFRYAFVTDADVMTLQAEEITDARWYDLDNPEVARSGLTHLAALLPALAASAGSAAASGNPVRSTAGRSGTRAPHPLPDTPAVVNGDECHGQ
ncbi:NUDIX domain-containing protein [Streptacidiphilus sp. NEAU-YB345]|uniref:NUDIX domain-containing protein n=1 Tax=Streptacidiphilus fuscans TaxID=2789292 RepID=A0A931BAV1_9ACTN|nr:NUDIX domain-containing protein [Streptacidiphilus fuscans]